jgi:hypothetical protein
MKYYSELTQKVYNTEAECKKAEQAFNFELEQKARAEEQKKLAEKKKQEERAADAKKVEALREEMVKAQANYRKAVQAFVEKHGSYHFSTKSEEQIPYLFSSVLDFLNL